MKRSRSFNEFTDELSQYKPVEDQDLLHVMKKIKSNEEEKKSKESENDPNKKIVIYDSKSKMNQQLRNEEMIPPISNN